jgi:hypothetical protein
MAARKPLSFDVGDAAPVPQTAPAATRPAKLAAPQDSDERQQVGARIKKATYRQLKARAALEGRKVQELVEAAVERYLAETTS